MGINATEGAAVADKAARLKRFVAVPLAQRYQPFATRARELLAAGRFGPVSHIYVRIDRPGPARQPGWGCPWMLDPAEAGGGCLRNLGPHGFDMFLHLTGEEAQATAAQLSCGIGWLLGLLGRPVSESGCDVTVPSCPGGAR